MSRTPETIVNKTAQTVRSVLIVAGLIAGFLAFGAFQNEGQAGPGIVLSLVAIAALFIAMKIKVVWRKGGEVGWFH